ncbi:MAG: hypothetical protein JRF43_01765 [Deltaproteobacteria bacterium]|nr:hypothetical protein [Deltaproteobacteria bacterium]
MEIGSEHEIGQMHRGEMGFPFSFYFAQQFKIGNEFIKVGPLTDLVMGWCCGAGETDTDDVQLQINQLSDGIFSKKHSVCSKSCAFASILANPDHLKDIVVKKRFPPSL